MSDLDHGQNASDMTQNQTLAGCLTVAELAHSLRASFGSGPDGIIFDCDGVLVDSSAGNIHYYNMVRQGLGLPPISPEQERYVQMSTARQALEAIVPLPLRSSLREVARSISYRREILPLLHPYEGLRTFLDACAARSLRLGVHTNRLDGMPDLLHKCDLEGIFDPVITAAHGLPKPDPHGTCLILEQWKLPARRVLFVGDSSTDRDAAAGAGTVFLAFRNPGLAPGNCCGSFADMLAAMQQVWAD